MDDNKYFKLIWRFNSVVIMAAGVMALAGTLIAFILFLVEISKTDDYKDLVNIEAEDSVGTEFELGYMTTIVDSPYLMVPLNSSDGYIGSYSSGKSWAVHNYLFINSNTNGKHWLFNTNQFYIAEFHLLNDDKEGSSTSETRGILYEVIKEDSNGDDILSSDDAMTLALSLTGGDGYKEILDDIDVFIGHKFDGKDSLLVIFQRGDIGYSANIRLSDFTLINESPLPEVGF